MNIPDSKGWENDTFKQNISAGQYGGRTHDIRVISTTL